MCSGAGGRDQRLTTRSWPFIRSWTWTAQVFFTLHLLALFMKMHSYAYVQWPRRSSVTFLTASRFYNGHLSVTQRRLFALDSPNGESREKAVKYPSSRNLLGKGSQDGHGEDEDSKAESLERLREDLAMELTSPLGRVSYPQNLTASNYVDFLFCPTLCYELEYPRTDGIRYMELFWK